MCIYTCNCLFLSQVYPGTGLPVCSISGTPVVFVEPEAHGAFGCKTPSPFKRFPLHKWVFLLQERHPGATESYSLTQTNQLDKQPPPQLYNKTHNPVKTLFWVFSGFRLQKNQKKHILTHSHFSSKAKMSNFLGFSVLFTLKCVKEWGNPSLYSRAFLMGRLSCGLAQSKEMLSLK